MLNKNYKTTVETPEQSKELQELAMKCGYKRYYSDSNYLKRYILFNKDGLITAHTDETYFWHVQDEFTYVSYNRLMQLFKANIEPTIKPCPVCQGECAVMNFGFVFCDNDCGYCSKRFNIDAEAIQWHNDVPRWYEVMK